MVQISAEDLLAQIQQDFPHEHEVASLRLLVNLQDQRIQAQDAELEVLKAQLDNLQPSTYIPSTIGPYVGTAHIDVPSESGGRHGG